MTSNWELPATSLMTGCSNEPLPQRLCPAGASPPPQAGSKAQHCSLFIHFPDFISRLNFPEIRVSFQNA
jgi:hypothetical protein